MTLKILIGLREKEIAAFSHFFKITCFCNGFLKEMLVFTALPHTSPSLSTVNEGSTQSMLYGGRGMIAGCSIAMTAFVAYSFYSSWQNVSSGM